MIPRGLIPDPYAVGCHGAPELFFFIHAVGSFHPRDAAQVQQLAVAG